MASKLCIADLSVIKHAGNAAIVRNNSKVWLTAQYPNQPHDKLYLVLYYVILYFILLLNVILYYTILYYIIKFYCMLQTYSFMYTGAATG